MEIEYSAGNAAQGTTTGTPTETTTEEITFTSADEAIQHALSNKQAITADNGNIRLERSSLGNWQLSVAWQDKAGFDDDSIVMDTDLSLLTGGRGFNAVGDKMVMTFKEDRLPVVIRRLYGKMPLQGIKAQKAQAEAIADNSIAPMILRKKRKKPKSETKKVKMPVSKVQQLADRFKINHPGLKNLEIIALNETTDFEGLGHTENNSLMGGIYVKGTNRAYLFSNNLRSFEEVQTVLRHETFAHFAFDALPEAEQRKMIDGIAKAIRTDEVMGELYRDVEERGYSGYREELKYEEVFSHLANEEIKQAGLKKLWFKIRQIIRKYLGIDLIRTPTELQGFIADFAARVATGQYEPTATVTKEIKGLPERIVPHINRAGDTAEFTSPNNSNNPADNANRLFSTLALAENELIKNALKVTGRKANS